VSNFSNTINALAGADGDNDGRNEVYAACQDGRIYRFKKSGAWASADLGVGGAQAMLGVSIGNGTGSNNVQVYGANSDGNVYQFTYSGSTWTRAVLQVLGESAGSMTAVSVGCAEGGTLPAVYAANANGKIYQFKWNGSTWANLTVNTATAMANALAIGDADNDGIDELYAACADGHVYQFRKQGSSWLMADAGSANTSLLALAIGNGENTNQHETYAVGANAHVYQFKAIAGVAPTPTPTPASTAPQKYFKIIPSLINPQRSEQAVVRWSQPKGGVVNITIYTLNGDKVISLVDHQEYASGQYHEVKWNGRNRDSAAVGSGIYIVLLQAPEYQDVSKCAVIK
jgi:hypothetical protein